MLAVLKYIQNQSGSRSSRLSTARTNWMAERDAHMLKMAAARRQMIEVKKLIDEKKAYIKRLILQKQLVQRKRKLYQRHIGENSATPVDALSREFEHLGTSSEVDSDEEWLASKEALEDFQDLSQILSEEDAL